MNIASAILNIYNIEGLSMEEYRKLFSPATGKRKYRIKLDTKKNGILVQDLKNAKIFMLKCVKEYYSPTENKQTFTANVSCNDVRDRLDLYSCNGCEQCHSQCISKIDSKELYKIKTI